MPAARKPPDPPSSPPGPEVRHTYFGVNRFPLTFHRLAARVLNHEIPGVI